MIIPESITERNTLSKTTAIIYPEDVVRPRNHKWADQTEQLSWQSSYEEEDDQCKIYYNRRRAPHMERATDVGQLDPAINLVKNVTTVNTCLWNYKAAYLILKELAKR